MSDANRIETAENRGGVSYNTVVGSTLKGRLLVVIWVDHPGGRLPIHGRQAGRRAARRYYK